MSLRKLLKQLFLSTIISMLSTFWLYNHLGTHTVYYFKHSHLTPKKGIPFILVDYLYYHINPDFVERKSENGIFRYSYDGINYITYLHLKDSENYSYSLSQVNYFNYKYKLRMPDPLKTDGENAYYFFDRNFNPLEKTHYPSNSVKQTSFSDEEKHLMYQTTNQTASQLLDNLPTPIIDLQWFFDWTYKGHKIVKIFLLSFLMTNCLTGIKIWWKRRLKRNSDTSSQ
ncbi:hypothetical protein [Streptococcus himalayensis]|uniref:Uncharacterized protein n=1 Tax=Streptococcus himalayensis TaxID=1888195 RepID=A0A917EF35_9STRE|nr:hypothetical protein [Streptococcus himalayensis]GGE32933.1 hypothetical protein GCM10011510_12840 [Streptococcus himalayensis]